MVAKAKGDLFDFTVGGAGFHVTAHLIALAALFIACFAIAGYITFRGDSIPSSALKDDVSFDESLSIRGIYEEKVFEVDMEGITPNATDNAVIAYIGALPQHGNLVDVGVVVTELGSNATLTLELGLDAVATTPVGTAVTGTTDVIGGAGVTAGSGGTLNDTVVGIATGQDLATNFHLYLTNSGGGNTPTRLTSGKVKVYARYIGAL